MHTSFSKMFSFVPNMTLTKNVARLENLPNNIFMTILQTPHSKFRHKDVKFSKYSKAKDLLTMKKNRYDFLDLLILQEHSKFSVESSATLHTPKFLETVNLLSYTKALVDYVSKQSITRRLYILYEESRIYLTYLVSSDHSKAVALCFT